MDEFDAPSTGIPPELIAKFRARIGADAPGEPIPEVDPNQMKAYWDIYDKEKDVAYAASAWHLSPGAVYGKPLVYRCWMLKLLESVPVEAMPQLASIKENGRLIDAAVRVGARFPMKWMKMGKQELPYDRAAFIEEVRKESGGV